MIALMIGLALLAAWATVAAIVVTARDGYRAVPHRPELQGRTDRLDS